MSQNKYKTIHQKQKISKAYSLSFVAYSISVNFSRLIIYFNSSFFISGFLYTKLQFDRIKIMSMASYNSDMAFYVLVDFNCFLSDANSI